MVDKKQVASTMKQPVLYTSLYNLTTHTHWVL